VKHSHLRIRDLKRRGLTWQQIMDRIGCSRSTIARALADDIDAYNAKEYSRLKRFRQGLCNGLKVWDGATIGRRTTSAQSN
jgi:transcriptional regulator with XRE-family HTH domain